jgi:hypothetical protein
VKTFMEKPETQAKLEQMRAQTTKLQGQLAAAVNRVLNKRQAAACKKMLGTSFDVSKVRGGPGFGPGLGPWNRPANANPTDRSRAGGAAQASGQGRDPQAATAKSPPATKDQSSTAKAKRKSLRELRGLDE